VSLRLFLFEPAPQLMTFSKSTSERRRPLIYLARWPM
jgi:hypothetical protein